MRRLAGICAAWLVLSAVGTAEPRGQSAGRVTLSDILRERMEPAGAVSWSSTRRLTWSDYRGAPILSGDEGAHTAYSLFSAARCSQDRFEFIAIAAILPSQSWVRPAVVSDAGLSRAALQHEQTHFDLTETYARRMRKYFEELYDPCARSEAELDGQAQRYVTAEATMQSRYDEETSNGRIADKQAAWDAEVVRQLASLGRYARDR